MLASRGLLERTFSREKQVGVDAIRNTYQDLLARKKLRNSSRKIFSPETLDLCFCPDWAMPGIGQRSCTLERIARCDGKTPWYCSILENITARLHPFGMIESKNYYRAFKLVPEDGKKINAGTPR